MSVLTRRPKLATDLRRRVLAQNGGKCVYCSRPAESVDHVVPWCASKDDSEANLVPCCRSCNSRASGLRFGSFEEKKAYLNRYVEMLKRGRLWEFGDQLAFMLRNYGLDQDDAADKCGIGRFSFNDILLNLRLPTKAEAALITKKLKVLVPAWAIEEAQ